MFFLVFFEIKFTLAIWMGQRQNVRWRRSIFGVQVGIWRFRAWKLWEGWRFWFWSGGSEARATSHQVPERYPSGGVGGGKFFITWNLYSYYLETRFGMLLAYRGLYTPWGQGPRRICFLRRGFLNHICSIATAKWVLAQVRSKIGKFCLSLHHKIQGCSPGFPTVDLEPSWEPLDETVSGWTTHCKILSFAQ